MRFIKIEKMKDSSGFTLIEVVVSLVVAGILGAMLVAFMNSTVVKSANPVINAKDGAYLNTIMERMYSDYKYQMSYALLNSQTPETAMSNFEANVDTANKYSDSSHPYAVTKKRISFTGTPPQEVDDSDSKILKVTITYQGLSATQLFTE